MNVEIIRKPLTVVETSMYGSKKSLGSLLTYLTMINAKILYQYNDIFIIDGDVDLSSFKIFKPYVVVYDMAIVNDNVWFVSKLDENGNCISDIIGVGYYTTLEHQLYMGKVLTNICKCILKGEDIHITINEMKNLINGNDIRYRRQFNKESMFIVDTGRYRHKFEISSSRTTNEEFFEGMKILPDYNINLLDEIESMV